MCVGSGEPGRAPHFHRWRPEDLGEWSAECVVGNTRPTRRTYAANSERLERTRQNMYDLHNFVANYGDSTGWCYLQQK
jgi:hypothetical protein